jgi:dephospho-CoA kinase
MSELSHNLYILVGQPNNGKTTLSRWMAKLTTCEVVTTDQVYHSWIKANHPKEFRAARLNIRGHYPTLSREVQAAWNEHVTAVILDAMEKAEHTVVAEGWLLLYLPAELRAKLATRADILTVHMRRYTAHVAEYVFKSNGKDYTDMVHSLCRLLPYKTPKPYIGVHPCS